MSSCSTHFCSVLLNYIVPILGNATAVFVTLSPMKAVMLCREKKSLGNLNPTPFAFIYANALAWTVYGYFLKDYFIISPNLVGIVAALFYTHNTFLLSTAHQQFLTSLVMYPFTFLILTSGAIAFISLPDLVAKNLLGSLCIFILVLFYGSPLSTMYRVVKEKNSSHFYLPLSIASLFNGVFWTAYGMAVADPYVYAPNAIGTVFAVIQILFRILYPAKEYVTLQNDEGNLFSGSVSFVAGAERGIGRPIEKSPQTSPTSPTEKSELLTKEPARLSP